MQNPKVATRVGELITKSDQQIISERIATREEVLAAISEFMTSGEPRDSVRLKAAETMGKHYGLFTDRLAVEPPQRTPEEVNAELEKLLKEFEPRLDDSENSDAE
jgi:predicted component of type VI protein secretion system